METKISVIKEELQAASYKELPLFISKYETDERSGVAAPVSYTHLTLPTNSRV